jgi:hypothetical protein
MIWKNPSSSFSFSLLGLAKKTGDGALLFDFVTF